MIPTKNEDITYLNHGNVDLDLKGISSSKNLMAEQDNNSTKVEAESERGEKVSTNKRSSKSIKRSLAKPKSLTCDGVTAIAEEEVSKKRKRRP